MMKKLVSLFAIFMLSMSTFSSASKGKRLFVNTKSQLYINQTIDIEKLTEGLVSDEMFYSLPVRDKNDGPIVRLLILDSSIYAMEKCRLNVWKWENNKWVNKYKDNNKGLCINSFYEYNNELLGFTSEGFWFSQSAIYVFNEIIGSWELRNIKNEVPPFLSFANFRIGSDTIVSFQSQTTANGLSKNNSSEDNFGFDLKSNKWFRAIGEYDLRYFNDFRSGFTFDLENVFHVFDRYFHVIINKKTKEIFYQKNTDTFDDIDFYFNNYSSGIVLFGGKQIALKNAVPTDFISTGYLRFENIKDLRLKEISKSSFSYWWLVIVLVAMIFGIFFGRHSKVLLRKISFKANPSIQLLSVLEKSGSNYSSRELDVLLHIDDDKNSDSRRVRRSRIIKDLNKEYQKLEGKEIITRQKDLEDKRYIIFRIEK